MNCPYYKDKGSDYIECKRGYSMATRMFFNADKTDKHIQKHCNCKYTQCKTYKKLDAEWGAVLCT